jgi:hypothetical protein
MSDFAKLSSALPAGDRNGLGALVAALTNDPTSQHAVLALVDCVELTTKTDTGEIVPKLRIRRIEGVLRADNQTARLMLTRAFENRTGRTALPIDVTEDLDEAFGPDEDEPR